MRFGRTRCRQGEVIDSVPARHAPLPASPPVKSKASVVVGDPLAGSGDPLTGFFNTAAFARPGRGNYGDAPRNVVRKPGLVNTNFAIFKNVTFGGSRAAQIRAEIYNLFNQVEFQDIDRTARFDATGAQINPNFGTAIGIASPTRPPRVIQLSVRLSF